MQNKEEDLRKNEEKLSIEKAEIEKLTKSDKLELTQKHNETVKELEKTKDEKLKIDE